MVLYLCIGQNQKNQPDLVLYLVWRSKIFVSVATLAKAHDTAEIRRHLRNVVSALGHFASFIVSMAHLLLIPAIYLLIDGENVSGPLAMCRLIAFLFPSINFFVYPFIETMFSENLRTNFIQLILCKLM